MRSAGIESTIASGGDAAARRASPPPLATLASERYVDRVELSRGGMGRILVARDLQLGRKVAVKELRGHHPDLVERFTREAHLTARLQHPSIVGIHEAGCSPSGEPFYVMELVAGRPLDQVVADAATGAARLALVPHVLAVADALAYAHRERIIHRDLKPHNVMIGEFGETVVIDWGLAKDLAAAGPEPGGAATTSGGAGMTVDGEVLGTPSYMPPEQARGDAVDERCDVYAIGALLYHVLAGRPPFTGRSTIEVIELVQHEAPPSLEAIAPGVPDDLRAIIERAMARDPDARYPTARELAEDLRRFQAGQLVGAHRYSIWQLAKRWLRRHRAVASVVALAIVTLGVTGALALRSVLAADARSDRARVLAEYHRGNAEELIDFILGDLHAKLVEVGKLDLLDTAATKIRTYYDERGATSPEDALRFARLHLERGDILVERRSLEAARAEYAHALTWSWAATFGSGATAAVLRTRADTYNRLGEIAAQDGDFDAALRAHREQLAASAQLVALAPDDVRAAQDLNISRMVIADDLMELGEAAQAITALEAARAAASTHDDAEGRRQRFLIEDRLALLLAERGDRAGALGAARAALGLAEAQRDPDDVNTLLALALAHGRVGDALGSAGDHAGAQDAYRASRGLLEALVAHDPSNNTWQDERLYAYLRLANAQLAAGDPQAAAATARAANFVPVDDPLAPKVAEFAELEGDIARAFGDRAAAERALRRATVAMAARVADRPSDRREQRSLARCRRKLAEVARATP